MNELALFTGAGGGLLGSRLLGWRPVCAVEIDPYCQEILLRRQEEGHLEPFPIWDDIRSFDGKPWRGTVDIVTGGFPCQPHSCAGKRKGEADERGGEIWRHTVRVIREVQPPYCYLENVPGLISSGMFGTVVGDLAESGYGVKWRCLSAAECGAPHRRDRLWIVGESNAVGCDGRKDDQGQGETGRDRAAGPGEELADAEHLRCNEGISGNVGSEESEGRTHGDKPDRCSWWDADPADVANTEGITKRPGLREGEQTEIGRRRFSDRSGAADMVNTYRARCVAPQDEICSGRDSAIDESVGPTQPRLGRVAHGVAYRVDRLKAIGNGQVPAVVREAWGILNADQTGDESTVS